MGCLQLLKTKNKKRLNSWFIRVRENGSIELQRFAARMKADAAVICEAISSRWSNGVVVEGM